MRTNHTHPALLSFFLSFFLSQLDFEKPPDW